MRLTRCLFVVVTWEKPHAVAYVLEGNSTWYGCFLGWERGRGLCNTKNRVEWKGFEYSKYESGCWENFWRGHISVVFAAEFGEICTGNNTRNCKSVLFCLFLCLCHHPEDTLAWESGGGALALPRPLLIGLDLEPLSSLLLALHSLPLKLPRR